MHQIGVGVLGPVFRAYEPDGDGLLALKSFHLDLTPEQSRTFVAVLQDVVDTGAVDAALVAPVAAELSDEIPYLALEYVPAESLDVAIRQYAPAPVDTALPFVVRLAEGIDAAHAAGLTHGALHLRDMFVTSGRAKMTGFGVVPAIERVGLRGRLRRPYAAPEQIAGAEWGAAADRFAFAAIVYELLTGRRAAGAGAQVLDPLPGVPGAGDADRLAQLFAAALADRPEGRPGSATMFADDLAEAVGWSGAGRDSFAGAAAAGVTVGDDTGFNDETEAEGAGMAMRDRPDAEREPEFDWSEQSLDRGESEDPLPAEEYQPLPLRGRESSPPASEVDTSEVDRHVDVPAAPDLGDAVDDDLAAAADADAVDDDLAAAAADADAVDDDPAAAADADAVDDDLAAAVDAAAADTDGVEHAGDHLGDAAGFDTDVEEDEDADWEIQPDDDGPVSRIEGAYEAVTLADLEDRLAAAADGDDTKVPIRVAHGSEAADGAEDEAGGDVDDEYGDYGEDPSKFDGYEPDVGGVVAGWSREGRRFSPISVGAIGLGVVAAAFAVGFGFFADGGSPDPADPAAPAETALANAETPPAAEAAEVRDYSERTVSREPEATAAADANEPPASLPQPASPAPVPAAASVSAARAPPPAAAPRPTEARTAPPPAVAPRSTEAARAPPPAAAPRPTEAATAPPAGRVAPPPPPRPAAGPATSPVSADGRLLLRTTPAGAQVVVNGEALGTTPLVLSNLSFDTYDVVLRFEGYEPHERRVTVSAADPIVGVQTDLIRISVPAAAPVGVGSIFVDTRPQGAQVWLDRQLVGETPMRIPDVTAGFHEVEFKQDGYRGWATTVQVGSSAEARVTASLDRAR